MQIVPLDFFLIPKMPSYQWKFDDVSICAFKKAPAIPFERPPSFKHGLNQQNYTSSINNKLH